MLILQLPWYRASSEMFTAQTARSGSSVIKKSNTIDDELEELNSPLTSVVDGLSARLTGVKKHYCTHQVRYQLLHDIWKGKLVPCHLKTLNLAKCHFKVE
jgi:hypothetical protein